jgi:ribosomal protein S30
MSSTEAILFGKANEAMKTMGGKLLGGKVHGSLARAGKVKGQTPKVEAEEKKKRKTGRAARRAQYNRRFVTTSSAFGGKRKGPNCQADRVDKK